MGKERAAGFIFCSIYVQAQCLLKLSSLLKSQISVITARFHVVIIHEYYRQQQQQQQYCSGLVVSSLLLGLVVAASLLHYTLLVVATSIQVAKCSPLPRHNTMHSETMFNNIHYPGSVHSINNSSKHWRAVIDSSHMR